MKAYFLKNFLVGLAVFVVGGFVFAEGASAAIVIEEAPGTVADNQEFRVKIKVTVTGGGGNYYYIRPGFSHSTTPSSYFGYIKNNSGNWYNGEPTIDKTQFLKVQLNPFVTWNDFIDVKPDLSSSAYKGVGSYSFKVGRYTETGTSVTEWSDSVTITITSSGIVTPSPSPSPTPVVSPTPTPSPTAVASASPTPSPTTKTSPTPKPTSTPTPTAKPKASPTPSVLGADGVLRLSDVQDNQEEKKLVLGVQGEGASPSPTPEGETSGRQLFAGFSRRSLVAGGFIVGGVLLLALSVFAFLKDRFKKSDTIFDTDNEQGE